MKPIITWFVPESWKAKILRLLTNYPVWNPEHSLASVWIRGYQVAPYLENLGYQVFCNRLKPKPSVAIFLRRYSHKDLDLARYLKQQGVKIVTDVVANYFEVREPVNGVGGASRELVESFRQLINISDQVWCVSPFLRNEASNYHSNVYFIADSVDPAHFKSEGWNEEKNKKELVLGWSGYSLKADALTILKPWLISKRCLLLIISNEAPKLNVQYEFRKWNYKGFPKYISECDLCVAPREVQDDYNRGHSFFKIGVFMAMGVPALAGPVPSYKFLIGDDKGGAICRTRDDWMHHIERFISNPELRYQWHKEARKSMEPFLTPNIARQIDSLLKKMMW